MRAELGQSIAAPEATVDYPFYDADGRARTGALIGPASAIRDQLLVDLCRTVTSRNGLVWCAEAWQHAAPPELATLAATHFVLTQPARGGASDKPGVTLAAEFDALDLLITTRLDQLVTTHAAGVAVDDLDQLDPLLVVLYEADGLPPALAEQLLRRVRRGASVGVGFLIVSPTTDIAGCGRGQLLEDLALDSGACIVLGTAVSTVLRDLRVRHGSERLRNLRAAPSVGYLLTSCPPEAIAFQLEARV